MLATTGTALAGLGGGAVGAVGAVLGPGGVVTGLTPIVGTLGLLGKDVIYAEIHLLRTSFSQIIRTTKAWLRKQL